MSVRRGLTVLVIAGVAAALAAPAATAKTKVVVAGGPPPKASQAGGLKFPAELDLNGFFRKTVTIHAGDSVKWVCSKRVVHTVTFLAKGDSRPPLEQPDPANPYTGYNDSQGLPFWFNGQPSIQIPPQNAFPQGGSSADGKTYRNSGLSAPAFKRVQAEVPEEGHLQVPLPRASRHGCAREGAAEVGDDPVGARGPQGTEQGVREGPQGREAARQAQAVRQQRGRRQRQRHRRVVPLLPGHPHDQGRPVGAVLDHVDVRDPHDVLRAAGDVELRRGAPAAGRPAASAVQPAGDHAERQPALRRIPAATTGTGSSTPA